MGKVVKFLTLSGDINLTNKLKLLGRETLFLSRKTRISNLVNFMPSHGFDSDNKVKESD